MDLRNWEMYAGSGNPLVGATVKLYSAVTSHPNAGTVLQQTLTDASGMWQFTGLTDGDYDVKVELPGTQQAKWYKGLVRLGVSELRAVQNWVELIGQASVAAPGASTGRGRLYMKTDGKVYYRYENGSEKLVKPSGEIISTDIVPGAAYEILRTNSGGTAVEWGTIVGNMVVGGTLSNAHMANRTRDCWLGVNDFHAIGGSPAKTLFVLSNPAWAFDAASEEQIVANWACPADIVAGTPVTIILVWTKSDANSGNVVWAGQTRLAGAGASASADNVPLAGSGTTDAVPATSGVWKHTTLSTDLFNGTSPAAGMVSQIAIARLAASGSDTYGSDAWLAGVILRYTADM